MLVPEQPGAVSATVVPRDEVVTLIRRPQLASESSLGHDVQTELFFTHNPGHGDGTRVHQRFRLHGEGEVTAWDLTAMDGVTFHEVYHREVHPRCGIDQR
ncbi:hypothetical protein D3C84_865170 [compost metagenome]